MSELGWRAKSSHFTREVKPIAGLRDDFGVRVQSAVEAMRDNGVEKPTHIQKKGRGKLGALQSQNKGVEERAERDRQNLETDDSKEAKRLESLEAKARLYEEMQKRVNVDDEAANDLHEVDFIAKALAKEGHEPSSTVLHLEELSESAPPQDQPLHPEDILRQQQAVKLQLQGGEDRGAEYSTYDADLAHLQARFKHVDELNEMNAAREAEFKKAEARKQGKEIRKRKEGDSQKSEILKQLMLKKQRLKKPT